MMSSSDSDDDFPTSEAANEQARELHRVSVSWDIAPSAGLLELQFEQGDLDSIGPSQVVLCQEEVQSALEAPKQAGEAEEAARGPVPQLDIVMLVAGTRGDVQPFIALGLGLQKHGHRVRLATHAVFRDFVTKFGLEFYPLGGNPMILSEYIVQNRGVIPHHLESAVESGREVKEVLFSTYKACTEPDPGDPAAQPFTAQAIIANPPSYGHIHCAEKLGVPLHMVFTMPWTPTKAFPSPLTRVNIQSATVNKLSYTVIADFIYAGMLRMINKFRANELGLDIIRTGNRGGTLVHFHQVPFMYCWSEAVVPKPDDWPSFVDVVGNFFLEEAALSSYQPPSPLVAFLEAGPPPVYVGFGSLMVDDPQGLTRKVVEAAGEAGVRLLVSKGWGGLGEGLEDAGPDVFLLETGVPHDWLFQRCAAVVHHGGAGTTAAGLKAGCPTTIVPFFGDQHFWGHAVHRMGLGPEPIPVDNLTTAKLVAALKFMQQAEVKAAAQAAAEQIGKEDGVATAVECFHRHLPLAKLAAGERVEWNLSQPRVSNYLHEAGAGCVNVIKRPVQGLKHNGPLGAVKGTAQGVIDLGYRHVKGLMLTTKALDLLAKEEGGKMKERASLEKARLKQQEERLKLMLRRQGQ